MKEETIHETACNGFEALYFAVLDSDVALITGVPGYPVTSLMELFLKTCGSTETETGSSIISSPDISRTGNGSDINGSDINGSDINGSDINSSNISRSNKSCLPEVNCPAYRASWLTNEKVALEVALGASVSGRRALVLVKHVGMNLLSDPLITSVTHTIGAGLIIIAGDDPGVKGSQNEQDSRWYGKIAEVAVFDPSSPETAYRSLRRAYELSEERHIPVIIRVTAGLEKSKGKIKRFPAPSVLHPEFDRSIWKLRMVEKHEHFHSKVYPMLEYESENTDLNEIREKVKREDAERTEGEKSFGVISSGFASSLVEEVLVKSGKHKKISHFVLNLVNPLPLKKIGVFLKDKQKVLVVEESEPFIEEQIRIEGNVYGKKTGHLPYGQVTSKDIDFALEHIEEEKVSRPADPGLIESRKKSRASICEDCPYLPLYNFLRISGVRVAGDMGCSVRSAPEPLSAVDVSFALGSAISVACGFERKGIAVIGDFALAHSGILGLLNAVSEGHEVLVLVLQNEIAAMTGGQKVPDLRKVIEAIVPDVLVFDMDGRKGKEQASGSELSDIITEKLALPGISVIFIKGVCRKY
ncbi:thiamine pyrophosphate-dependent enzyme [Methanosarcina mazei]|uniref:Indolepyruvate oxidoreductase subunit IorA n=1 Tax=Methanosarcina mazei SarPi TaxID=1434115 RepID=A0A0E3R911_METMZ|nr:indolepyruvate ferredoxin oxidoreductase subunit alpha [Methanosarcina mazei]AKB61815.1 Indolepyruvate oxidoreductase subunit IorA [Methanosarcina mazei SarPi]